MKYFSVAASGPAFIYILLPPYILVLVLTYC